MIGIMRLKDLRWYDWLFVFLALLWIVPIAEALFHIGVLWFYVYAVLPGLGLYVSLVYCPIYLIYKIYKWKKGKSSAR